MNHFGGAAIFPPVKPTPGNGKRSFTWENEAFWGCRYFSPRISHPRATESAVLLRKMNHFGGAAIFSPRETHPGQRKAQLYPGK
jgi:hypothetical protein